MALRIEIQKQVLISAVEQAIASLKRSKAKQYNPAIAEFIEKDIGTLETAIRSITEIK